MITAPRLRTLPRPPDREVGAALPLVLAFVALFVVLVAALSGLGYTTSATARVSTDLRTKVSAADDALDVALRAHTAQLVSSGFQGDGLAACDDRMVAFPGVGEVEVECRLVASSYERAASPGSNAPEEAILAFDSGSKSVHHTNRAPIAVRGDVRSNGTLVAPGQNRHGAALEILDGNVDVKACRPSPGAQIIVDGGTLDCSWTGSVGSIESAIADYGIPTAAASIRVGVVPSTCPNRVARIQPGVFSTAQQLTDLNKLFRNELWPGADCEVFWFEPGMYRFGYSGVLQLRGTVVGGTPAGWHPDSAPTPSYPYGCERWDESTTDPDAVAACSSCSAGTRKSASSQARRSCARTTSAIRQPRSTSVSGRSTAPRPHPSRRRLPPLRTER